MAVAVQDPPPTRERKSSGGKTWVRRASPDRSQATRQAVQFVFLALNLWMGIQFYWFVRQFEDGGSPSWGISRPAGIEGWLPIAGMMNTKYFLLTGEVPRVHPATLFLFGSFLLASILFRKAFCGWLCPVGTVSEYLWKLGRSTFRRNFSLPRWLDIPLRSLKYVLMGLFVGVVVNMPTSATREFLESPYGLVADVKMLNFFRHMGQVAAVTVGILVILSVFVKNFWCRFLCPYGALMGLASLLSPLRIRRNQQACIDCAKCAKACPSQLPVDVLVQIRSAECLGCMECVAVCPAENALDMTLLAPRSKVQPWMIAAGVSVIFLGLVTAAKLTGHWDGPVSTETYQELIPRAREFAHPR